MFQRFVIGRAQLVLVGVRQVGAQDMTAVVGEMFDDPVGLDLAGKHEERRLFRLQHLGDIAHEAVADAEIRHRPGGGPGGRGPGA